MAPTLIAGPSNFQPVVTVDLCLTFKSIASFWAFSFLTNGIGRQLPMNSGSKTLHVMDPDLYDRFLAVGSDGEVIEFPAQAS